MNQVDGVAFPVKRDPSDIQLMIVLPSLDVGGTERQVALLCQGLISVDPTWRRRLTVVVLAPGGEFEDELPEGVPLVCVGRRGTPNLEVARRLRRLVKSLEPDAVYSLLAPVNLIAAVALLGRPERLIWGHRTGQNKISPPGLREALARRVLRTAARRVDASIANSTASKQFLESLPHLRGSISVVSNAIEVDRFQADPKVRRDQRKELGLSDDDTMVLSVGRLVDDKDHATLFAAFHLLRRDLPRAKLFLVGPGSPMAIRRRESWATELSIEGCYTYLGRRHDLARLYNAADVVVQSSKNEGASNVLVESLAVGVPTVSTDCGNASEVLPSECLASVGDARHLADAALRSLCLPIQRLHAVHPHELATATLAVILGTSPPPDPVLPNECRVLGVDGRG